MRIRPVRIRAAVGVRGLLAMALGGAALIVVAVPAHAAACDEPTTTWQAPNAELGETPTNLWSDPRNWSNGVPDATDRVCIPDTQSGFTPMITPGYEALAAQIDARSHGIEIGGRLTVSESMDTGFLHLNGGTLAGPGRASVALALFGQGTVEGSQVVSSGPDSRFMPQHLSLTNAAALDVHSTTAWPAEVAGLELREGARFGLHGPGVFKPWGSVWSDATGMLEVAPTGTLTYDNADTSGSIQAAVRNLGTIRALAGRLDLSGGAPDAVSTGTFAANGGTVSLGSVSSPARLGDGAVLDGVRLTQQVAVVEGATATGDDLVFDGAQLYGGGELRVRGATQVSWLELRESVDLTVPNGELLDLGTGSLGVLDRSTVDVEGELAQSGDYSAIYLSDDAVLDVWGVHHMSGLSAQVYAGSADPGTEIVRAGGRLVKEGSDQAFLQVPFVNHGTVSAIGGALHLVSNYAAAGSAGAFIGTAPGRIHFGGWTLDGGLRLLDGATVSGAVVDGRLQVDGRVPFSDTSLVSGGTVVGGGTMVVSGRLEGLGGNLGGAGSTVVPPGSSLVVPESGGLQVEDGREVVVRGTLELQGDGATPEWGGQVWLNEAAAVDVRGTAVLGADASVGGEGLLLVNGQLTADPGTGHTATITDADVEGTLRAATGTLQISRLRNTHAYDGVLTGGRYVASAGATLQLPSFRANAAVLELEGPGASFGNALQGLEHNSGNGRILLSGGADLTLERSFTDLPFSNRGDVRLSPGSELTVVGQGFAQTSEGRLITEVAAAGHGRVTADGPLALGGDLVVSRDASYEPEMDTVVDVAVGAGRAGSTFSRLLGVDVFSGRSFEADYALEDRARLRVVPASAPAPVSSLSTVDGQEQLTLSWDAPADADSTLVVQRRSLQPATSPDEGVLVCEVSGEQCRVGSLDTGRSYSFSAFTVRDGVVGTATTLVRHGTSVRLADHGDRVRATVRDVVTGRGYDVDGVRVLTRRDRSAPWRLRKVVDAHHGGFGVAVPSAARWLKVTVPAQGRHLPARVVLRR